MENERVAVEMSRDAWDWLLSAAYMGLSPVVVEKEKIAAIKIVERAIDQVWRDDEASLD